MLSDLKIKQAKPRDKDYKLYDAEGLFLQVSPAGGKLWKYKYRFDGRERKLSLGAYPVVSLLEAREARLAAQKLLAQGIDPGADKKARQRAATDAENTVVVVTRAWHATFSTTPKKERGQSNQKTWTEGHAIKLLHRLEKDIFPAIGNIPMSELTARDLLEVLERVAARSLETAHRLRIAMGQVCRWAVATGRASHDVSSALRGAIPPVVHQHMAAPTDPAEVGRLLRSIDSYGGGVITRSAMQLLPLVFLRPGELRKGRWEEIDFVHDQWNVPADRMKMKLPHTVPLSRQALRILKELHQVTGCSGWIFPGRSWSQPISDMTINAGLRYLGWGPEQITGHGFRAIARTLLDEQLHYRVDYIEHQLAHAVRDPLGRAYNRTTHLDERRAMMQAWADYLDTLKTAPPPP